MRLVFSKKPQKTINGIASLEFTGQKEEVLSSCQNGTTLLSNWDSTQLPSCQTGTQIVRISEYGTKYDMTELSTISLEY